MLIAAFRRVLDRIGGVGPQRKTLLAAPMKSAVLALLVKGFFLPLMTGFVLGHLTGLSNGWGEIRGIGPAPVLPLENLNFDVLLQHFKNVAVFVPKLLPTISDLTLLVHPWAWSDQGVEHALKFGTDLVFLVDCGFAFVGYLFESRFLGNKTKSVEPTMFGWVVALGCYPPFNGVLGTWLPTSGPTVIKTRAVLLSLRVATLGFYAIYAWATVAFGVKFSNLTNRGIVTRGPYRFLRHPAYVCKGIAWWLEQVPTMNLGTAASMVGINVWYALRAYTEEKHLEQDPDYRAYQAKVPWVLIPGLF